MECLAWPGHSGNTDPGHTGLQLSEYTFWVAWNAFPYKGLGYIQYIQEIISGLQNMVSVLPKYNGLYGIPGHTNSHIRDNFSATSNALPAQTGVFFLLKHTVRPEGIILEYIGYGVVPAI